MMTTIETHISQARRDAVLQLLYAQYPIPMGEGLLIKGVADDLRPNKRDILRALDYLTDRGDVRREDRGGVVVAWITPDGMDRWAAVHERAQIVVMLAMLRLRLLSNLNLGRGGAAIGVGLLERMLREDEDLERDSRAISRGLRYLSDRGLIKAKGRDLWSISAEGVDFLEGDGPDYTGILRPAEL